MRPPHFADEVTAHKAALLNTLLWVSLGAVLVTAGTIPFILPHPAWFELVLGIEVVLILGCLALLRHGAVQQASQVFLGGIWLIIVIVAFFSGGVNADPFHATILVVLAAGLLLDTRTSFQLAGLSTLAGLGLLIAEERHWLPVPFFQHTPIFTWLEEGINFYLGATLLYLATQTIEKALHHSQQTEQALLEANRSLQASEQNYRQLMEQAADGIFILNGQNDCVDVNLRGCEMLGFSRAELLQMKTCEIIPTLDPKTPPLQIEWLQPGQTILLERPLRCKDGTLLSTEINARVLENGNLQAIVRDITARKRVEAELQASEARFRNYIDHATDAFFLHDSTGVLLDVNRQTCETLGYSREELLSMNPSALDASLDEQAFARLQTKIQTEGIATFETLHRRKDGTLLPVEVRLRLYEEQGQWVGISLARDITEQKRAEAERQAHIKFLESLDRISRTIQKSNDLNEMMRNVLEAVLTIFDGDQAWMLYPCDPEALYWSMTVEHTRPAYPGAFAKGLAYSTSPEIVHLFQATLAAEHPLQFRADSRPPLPAILAQDFEAQAQLSMALYPKLDKPYLFGLHQCSFPRVWTPEEEKLFQEIARRLEEALTSRLAYRNLRDSERKLEEAQHMAQVGYWEFDLEAGGVILSDESWRIFGWQPREGKLDLAWWYEEWQKTVLPEDIPTVRQALAEMLQNGQPFDIEYAISRGSELCIVNSRGNAIQDEGGRITRVFGMTQDITKLRKTEQALHENETLYRALFEQSYDGVILYDAATNQAVMANQALAEMLECEITDLIGMEPTDNINPQAFITSLETWRHTLIDGVLPPSEHRLLTHKGHLRDFEVTANTISDSRTGGPRLIQAVLRDVTDRKQAETHLKTALEEKEILLKEIHHRVKNNLQVISSLLYLQSLKITDETLLELFRESRNRVAAMGLVHEQLYQTDNFAKINFGLYARTLAESLLESYGVTETQISLSILTDDTPLDLNLAIPCGLLVSEIMSNALKYAFPYGQQGHISISLHLDQGAHHLRISDDGVGLPDATQIRAGSLGMQLIDRLVAQMGGVLVRTGPPGTTYHIQILPPLA